MQFYTISSIILRTYIPMSNKAPWEVHTCTHTPVQIPHWKREMMNSIANSIVFKCENSSFFPYLPAFGSCWVAHPSQRMKEFSFLFLLLINFISQLIALENVDGILCGCLSCQSIYSTSNVNFQLFVCSVTTRSRWYVY